MKGSGGGARRECFTRKRPFDARGEWRCGSEREGFMHQHGAGKRSSRERTLSLLRGAGRIFRRLERAEKADGSKEKG